jgi:hypothetical protein
LPLPAGFDMTTTLTSYLAIANNLSKWQSITAARASVQSQNSYFTDNIGSIKTAKDFVNNYRLFSYAMTAFGLSDKIYAKGLMQKVLEQGLESNKPLAYTLNDARIFAFAKAFDFAGNGGSVTSSAAVKTGVVNNYVEQALEDNEAQQNPGVQLALYFQRQAPTITDAYGILADRNLLTVVQTALGISPYASLQNIDTQAAEISKQLNVADFKDPKKLQQFIEKFSALYDSNSASTGATSSSAAPNAILAAGPTAFGISIDTLSSLQNLQIGG